MPLLTDRELHEGDRAHMLRAVALAERGRLTAPPNPWVGCVLVRDGAVVGDGFHRAPGQPHAEVNALAAAGERARGATAYVTLEPCSHQGRTGPCVEALLAAGVAKVVVGVLDPDPRVSGQGAARLREAGVTVQEGVGADHVAASLAPYLYQRRTGRAYPVLKAAMSLDGRTAAADGSSRWITGAAARRDAHRLRAESGAVMVGSGTALADRPALTVRESDEPTPTQPRRVLLDGAGRVPAEGPLFDTSLAETVVFTTSSAPRERVADWQRAGARVEVVPAGAGRGIDLRSVLATLGELGVLQVLVEGGATLHGELLKQGLVERLVLYVGPCALGEGARPLVAGWTAASIEDASRWQLAGVRQLDQDVRLDYLPVRAE